MPGSESRALVGTGPCGPTDGRSRTGWPEDLTRELLRRKQAMEMLDCVILFGAHPPTATEKAKPRRGNAAVIISARVTGTGRLSASTVGRVHVDVHASHQVSQAPAQT